MCRVYVAVWMLGWRDCFGCCYSCLLVWFEFVLVLIRLTFVLVSLVLGWLVTVCCLVWCFVGLVVWFVAVFAFVLIVLLSC